MKMKSPALVPVRAGAASLRDVRLPGQCLFWVNFAGWHSKDDAVVDLHNPCEALPELHSGKLYKWSHSRKSIGFKVTFVKASQLKLNHFVETWSAKINDIVQHRSGHKSWGTKFMVRSGLDGKWYRATVVAPFERASLANRRPKRGRKQRSSASKRTATATATGTGAAAANQPNSSLTKLTQSFSSQVTVRKHGGEGTKFTAFCHDILFQHLLPTTKDAMVQQFATLMAADAISAMATAIPTTHSRCGGGGPPTTAKSPASAAAATARQSAQNLLLDPQVGLLCLLSHDMTLPVMEQLAALVVYKCHPQATVPFVEVVRCHVAPRFRAWPLGDAALKILVRAARDSDNSSSSSRSSSNSQYQFLAMCQCRACVPGLLHSADLPLQRPPTIQFAPLDRTRLVRADELELQCWSAARSTMVKQWHPGCCVCNCDCNDFKGSSGREGRGRAGGRGGATGVAQAGRTGALLWYDLDLD